MFEVESMGGATVRRRDMTSVTSFRALNPGILAGFSRFFCGFLFLAKSPPVGPDCLDVLAETR
jgi:hypothetical protein